MDGTFRTYSEWDNQGMDNTFEYIALCSLGSNSQEYHFLSKIIPYIDKYV